ncbi:MAG TPA: PPOX class F420-dependent oxidoreductase [Blastocatellia bacterium]|nr:PPOX class F420-dependent oxidoreductase [Blastocatellia bacterium]
MHKLTQFLNQNYLNLESYRRTGNPVATPMWFAERNGILYVYSLAHAGKVKRIRNNPLVRVAPSDMRGRPKGEWVEGRAQILDESGAALGHRLLIEKYGWMKRIGDLYSRLLKRERVVIAIEPN